MNLYKSLIFILYLGIFLGSGFRTPAQSRDSITLYGTLDTVQVIRQRIQHANEANAGARVTHISPAILQANKTRSLAELLTDHTSIYIKSLGTGALSTASFRGTSASQTRVNWNGINITPPLSGTFDFSQIPVFFTDNINLYYGSSHVKNGTGAIGGSVNLFTDTDWNRGVNGRVLAEYGSYNTYTVGGQANISGNKSASKTRLYYQHSDNDYTYLNKVLTNTPFREKRQDAAYSQFGIMQEGYFRVSPYTRLTAVAWYQKNHRNLPQPLGVVNRSQEDQEENNFRGYAGLDFSRGIHELHVKAAWLYFCQTYDIRYDGGLFDPKGNKNRSNTAQVVADYTYSPTDKLILNTTLTYSHDLIRVSSYIDIDSSKYTLDGIDFDIPQVESPFSHHRNILSWQTSALWTPIRWMMINGQYMFEHNDNRNVSTWSAGIVFNLLKKELKLKGSTAYNYRFPSMNDLYWRPGGNPDVKPEEGYSYDAYISYRKSINKHLLFDAEVSGYLMNIDNWILWLPKDGNQWVWTPQNKRNVRSYGVELYGKTTFHYGELVSSLSGNYSWSQSRTRKKQHVDDNAYMRQIPYVPRFKWNLRWNIDYKDAFFVWQMTYTGRRFITTDESYATDPYSVHNLLLGYRYSFRNGTSLTPQMRIDNLFDTYYESTQYYPMPLRNCLFSLLFEF